MFHLSARIALCSLLGAFVSLQSSYAESIGTMLQDISVNVRAEGSYQTVEGSGTLVVRPCEGQKTVWVLTAAHVVSDQRDVKTIVNRDGEEVKRIRYKDVEIVQEQFDQNSGRVVGEVRYDAKVITVDNERDIALLRVRKPGITEKSAVFYKGKEPVPVGTLIYHCGAPGGKDIGGTRSLTHGIVSRLGVKIPQYGGSEHGIYDHVSCPALPGSSGGLVALHSNGEWIGMITLGLRQADSFHWCVPIRSVREWAKEVGVEWLLDDNATVKQEQVDSIPIENTGESAIEDGEKHYRMLRITEK